MSSAKPSPQKRVLLTRIAALLAIAAVIATGSVSLYHWIDSVGSDIPNWLIYFASTIALALMGAPFAVGYILSWDLSKRFQISAILGGAIVTLVTSIFLIGEYQDQQQARIARSWQLLYQAEDRARSTVCEALRRELHQQLDCNTPPPVPSFSGTQELVCKAIRHTGLLEANTLCHGRTVVELAVKHGAEKICNILKAESVVAEKWPCVVPNILTARWSDKFPQNATIRSAMFTQFGQITAVQSLLNVGLPTHGLKLPWYNLQLISARPRQDLRSVDLSGANLFGARLSEVILGGEVILRSGIWPNSKVEKETHAGRANLSGTNFSQADLSDTALGGANLSDAILNRTDLSNANLRRSVISHAWLWQTDLTGADLSFADMFMAEFRRTELGRSILHCTDLTGATLNGVTGLTQVQLDSAVAHPQKPPIIVKSVDADTGLSLSWSENREVKCGIPIVPVRDW